MITLEPKYGTVGIGSVVIPTDLDRDLYISKCFSLGSCAIWVDEVGVIPDVKIGSNIQQFIEFPNTPDELGSMLSFFKTPKYNNHVAIDVIQKSDTGGTMAEHTFRLGRVSGQSRVEVFGDAKSASLMISVDTDEDDKGNFTINVSNNNKTALFNIKVNGKSDLEAENINFTAHQAFSVTVPKGETDEQTVISYTKGEGLSYSDEWGTVMTIKNKVIRFGTGKEPMVLGDTLKSLLDDILTQCSGILVTTALGAMPVLNKAAFELLKKRTSSILSELTKTD